MWSEVWIFCLKYLTLLLRSVYLEGSVGEMLYKLVYFLNGPNGQGWSKLKPEARSAAGSLIWLPWAQSYGPSFSLAGIWVRIGASGLKLMPVRDADISGCTYNVTYPALSFSYLHKTDSHIWKGWNELIPKGQI